MNQSSRARPAVTLDLAALRQVRGGAETADTFTWSIPTKAVRVATKLG